MAGLKKVRAADGPSPVQDGPCAGTAPAADDMGYLDTSGPEWSYLGHFAGREEMAEGHNVSAVSMKVGKLMHEGKPQKQAVAMALSMKRAGRLTKSGGYRRAK